MLRDRSVIVTDGVITAVTEDSARALLLFEGDPLTQPRDLLGAKTTIKDGVVYSGSEGSPR